MLDRAATEGGPHARPLKVGASYRNHPRVEVEPVDLEAVAILGHEVARAEGDFEDSWSLQRRERRTEPRLPDREQLDGGVIDPCEPCVGLIERLGEGVLVVGFL